MLQEKSEVELRACDVLRNGVIPIQQNKAGGTPA
jgi:hypothetical protein